MSRRSPHLDEDEENLFDNMDDVERELFADDDDSAPFYEDREEIEKLIEEELGSPRQRWKTRKRTK
ncbi:hypothetical protein vBCbaSRXM_151 [Citromicrobium phage vB_CbaS-RXM]|nr:hypothetical protein vBCbaSRXM_151 [Citromicrobium phage vB_CbaS-RXM]